MYKIKAIFLFIIHNKLAYFWQTAQVMVTVKKTVQTDLIMFLTFCFGGIIKGISHIWR